MTRIIKLMAGSALLAGMIIVSACTDDQGRTENHTPPASGTHNLGPMNSNSNDNPR
jgi:hypothetical protein